MSSVGRGLCVKIINVIGKREFSPCNYERINRSLSRLSAGFVQDKNEKRELGHCRKTSGKRISLLWLKPRTDIPPLCHREFTWYRGLNRNLKCNFYLVAGNISLVLIQ